MITIVDTGGANLASVQNALARLGEASEVTLEPRRLRSADRIILPGVGAAGEAMRRLRDSEVTAFLGTTSQPILGICLGMQLFFEASEEDDARCLGWLPGRVEELTPAPGMPVPHMGWNALQGLDSDWPLLGGVEAGAYFYFVHSFRAPSGAFVKASADYGTPIPACVGQENLYGVQFHPERSGDAGARVLANFLSL